jgi:hypothetical protein
MKSIFLELLSIEKLIEKGGPCPFSLPENYLKENSKFNTHILQTYKYLNIDILSSDASLVSRIEKKFINKLGFIRKFNENDPSSYSFRSYQSYLIIE